MNLTQLYFRLSLLIQFTGRLSIAVASVLTIALFAWHLLRVYPGDRWLLVRLGNYFAPWLFMSLIPALAVALLGRHRWLTGAILLLLLIFAGHYGSLLVPRLSQVNAETNASDLRVMTFNIHYSNQNKQDIANLIQNERPAIIAIQELNPGLASRLLPELASEYPYQLYEGAVPMQIALLSRYPLTAQPKPPEVQRALHATVETPDGVVTVWNVHPDTALTQGKWHIQKRMLAVVAREIEREKRPLIVMGDFNTTDQTENYDLIANHLTDVHHAVGRGFGFTYPEPDVLILTPWYRQPFQVIRPIFRIDHIFVSQHFVPQETHVIPDSFGSDHRPVVATLRFIR